MVLDVRTDGAVPLVLLRQLPSADRTASVPEDADDTALTRLNQALAGRVAPGEGHLAGPVRRTCRRRLTSTDTWSHLPSGVTTLAKSPAPAPLRLNP